MKIKQPSSAKCGNCQRFLKEKTCQLQPHICGSAFEDISDLASPQGFTLRYQSGTRVHIDRLLVY
jgi:hypothetical protein